MSAYLNKLNYPSINKHSIAVLLAIIFLGGLTLFTNNEPLIFYKAIANYAKKYLQPNGFLFFEINQKYGNETFNMLEEKGFLEIELIKDINGNDRIICCRK